VSREDRRSEEDWRAGAADPNPDRTGSPLVRYVVGFTIVLALAFAGWVMFR
jgi:hypothetical protein